MIGEIMADLEDYKDDNIWLMKGDCLERMKEIPDGSVDLILTDPPYGTTQCKWDSVIPFDEMWVSVNLLTKDNTQVVLFGSEPFSSYLRISNIQNYKYDWYWIKSRKNGFVHQKGMPLRQTENVHVFSKGSIRRDSNTPMKYNPQGVQDIKIDRVNYLKTTSAYSGGHDVGSKYQQTGFGYPVNLIQFKNVSPKIQIHPTQKPVELLEYLIRTYSNEGDTVLDFTMGSGSTAIACKNLNRRFIGIEQDDEYFRLAKERILNHSPSLNDLDKNKTETLDEW